MSLIKDRGQWNLISRDGFVLCRGSWSDVIDALRELR